MRRADRQVSARPRQGVVEGVAAYLADEDADVYNLIDAAVREDALAGALNLTALAADAVTALAEATGREPSDVLRSLRPQDCEQPVPAREPASRGPHSPSGVEVVYPETMDAHDWALTEAKGWIEVTVRSAGGQTAITFYDPTRLAQEVQSAVAQSGYFAERALVVVPIVTRDAIEGAATAIAWRSFVDVGQGGAGR